MSRNCTLKSKIIDIELIKKAYNYNWKLVIFLKLSCVNYCNEHSSMVSLYIGSSLSRNLQISQLTKSLQIPNSQFRVNINSAPRQQTGWTGDTLTLRCWVVTALGTWRDDYLRWMLGPVISGRKPASLWQQPLCGHHTPAASDHGDAGEARWHRIML